ncbi:hypothetical protein HRG_012162 [Hirsutella rhossiliensis]
MRLKAAVEYLERFPDSKMAKVARDFDVPRLRLRRRLEGRGPRNGNSEFHTKLTKAEETALCRSPPQVGLKWVGLFIKRHSYNLFPSKVLDANRQASEDVEMLNEYFQKLQAV